MINEVCPVCLGALERSSQVLPDSKIIHCIRCGEYALSDSTAVILNSIDADVWKGSESSISTGIWLRDQSRFQGQHREAKQPLLTSDVVNNLKNSPFFPDINTQLENLLTHVAQTTREPGVRYRVNPDVMQFIVGCRTSSGVMGLLNHLVDVKHMIEISGPGVSPNTYTISVKGWMAFEEVSRGRTSGRRAFIAMPFNRPDLDRVWLPALREAVADTGYELARVDDNPEPGLIDTKMRNEIRAARFLLVELTHGNNGAYWEAGFAEGLDKPVIYLRNEDDQKKAHFDVEHSFRIEWKADSMEAALRKLKATIREAMPDAIMQDR